jgi:hypothetical protein
MPYAVIITLGCTIGAPVVATIYFCSIQPRIVKRREKRLQSEWQNSWDRRAVVRAPRAGQDA